MLPRIQPDVADPHTAAVLGERWDKARRALWAALLLGPGIETVLCLVQLGFALGSGGQVRWWMAIPLLFAVLPGVALNRWVRRTGVSRRGDWARTFVLSTSPGLIGGALPAYAITAAAATLPLQIAAVIVFLLSWAPLALAGIRAGWAAKILVEPRIAELGATGLPIDFVVRFTVTPVRPERIYTARVWLMETEIVWHARRVHRRQIGPVREGRIPFGDVVSASTTEFSPASPPQPWVTLDAETTMWTTPGPAVELRLRGGRWILPISEAGEFVTILQRRLRRGR